VEEESIGDKVIKASKTILKYRWHSKSSKRYFFFLLEVYSNVSKKLIEVLGENISELNLPRKEKYILNKDGKDETFEKYPLFSILITGIQGSGKVYLF
jgi:hypothetical protein